MERIDLETFKNLTGELRLMKTLQMKPNFSKLARKYHIDRHTIKNNMKLMEYQKRTFKKKV